MKRILFGLSFIVLILMVSFLAGCDSLSVSESESLKFTVGKENSLRISTKNGAVTLTGWNNDYISVEARKSVSGMNSEDSLRDLLKKIEIVTVANGVNASVIVNFPEEANGLFNSINCGASLDICVPNQFSYTDIYTSNGRIEINGINSETNADTSNGSLELANFKGLVDLGTSNGGIRLSKVEFKSGRNIVKTSNGSISGDMVLPEDGSVLLDTSNGRIDLSIPADSKAYLEADTSNGNVTVRNISMEIIDESKSDLKAKLNGGGINLRAESSNGNISISGY